MQIFSGENISGLIQPSYFSIDIHLHATCCQPIYSCASKVIHVYRYRPVLINVHHPHLNNHSTRVLSKYLLFYLFSTSPQLGEVDLVISLTPSPTSLTTNTLESRQIDENTLLQSPPSLHQRLETDDTSTHAVGIATIPTRTTTI